jgi:hypothetical protein
VGEGCWLLYVYASESSKSENDSRRSERWGKRIIGTQETRPAKTKYVDARGLFLRPLVGVRQSASDSVCVSALLVRAFWGQPTRAFKSEHGAANRRSKKRW